MHRILYQKSIFAMIDVYNNLSQNSFDASTVIRSQRSLTQIARSRCGQDVDTWTSAAFAHDRVVYIAHCEVDREVACKLAEAIEMAAVEAGVNLGVFLDVVELADVPLAKTRDFRWVCAAPPRRSGPWRGPLAPASTRFHPHFRRGAAGAARAHSAER